ncbi:ATP-binding protein [Paenibacillus profundus]|uniref:ATP-binding protein n=1 Tax=Paenibacillus profundus TaxID=1173085 RepID=UPI00389965A2
MTSCRNGAAHEQQPSKRDHRLWEPFYVEESSRHKEISGTGLGLTIVKTILERHGFCCHAETKDQTIHFYIYLAPVLRKQIECCFFGGRMIIPKNVITTR